ncbi:hypothetical protein C1645_823479 [Glomus cerebriforme]|uniref:Sel1 repeat protein n=1 Tax=Glomus cerebriforme TaxID=658196 RepID=A0A397T0C3_9GLOM|nr:hypothetical protein C1645_823479 [Glomus cerebriforme]
MNKVNFGLQVLLDFFYQIGIGCDLDKEKMIELYFLAINNENEKDSLNENFKDKDTFYLLRNENIIIGKHLLSLFYYKDIIIDTEGFNYTQNRKNNEENEFTKFLNSAEKENSNAQYNLAICYVDGMGIQNDEEKAFEWGLKSEQNELNI